MKCFQNEILFSFLPTFSTSAVFREQRESNNLCRTWLLFFISTVIQNSILYTIYTCPCCVLLPFDILSRAWIDR